MRVVPLSEQREVAVDAHVEVLDAISGVRVQPLSSSAVINTALPADMRINYI